MSGLAARLPSRPERRRTAEHIASVQRGTGEIPWESDGHTDVWDMTEAVMGLQVEGLIGPAVEAFRWMRETQRADGSWPLRTRGGLVEDAGTDLNHCAYVAVGVWHHWLVTSDRALPEAMWPTVCRALDRVVEHQLPWGGFAWAVGAGGDVVEEALVTGTSSTHHALRCGVELARLLGQDARRWSRAADLARDALRHNDSRFAQKRRYSMDWYYPVLGGAVTGEAARARIDERWDDFVVPGLGIRCVDDHPWVTGAETCELALALTTLGDRGRAAQLVADMGHLRDPDGAYHTGYVYTDDARWPIERSTWTAGAVLLACDAIERPDGPTARLFRPTG